MRKFLIQQIINDQVCQGIYSEMQLISYLDMSDCYDGEYKIYDVTRFWTGLRNCSTMDGFLAV